MAKPPSKELKPKEGEGQGPKINLDTNIMLIANTIAIIAFLAIFSIINHAINKAMIEKEIAKIKPSDQIEATDSEESNVDEKGILLDLGDFILNLADASPRRYLKVNVAIELSRTQEEIAILSAPAPKAEGGHGGHGGGAAADPMAAIVAEMDQYKPAIRDSVISVLSSKTADELSSTTGKEIAKEEIQDLVSSIFNGSREVIRVSFGQFIIQ